MLRENELTKDTLDFLMDEVAKQHLRSMGKPVMPIEVIVVGGSAILLNYTFRNSTQDVDAWVSGSAGFELAIRQVAEKYGLPVQWLNQDFIRTDSFSVKLREISVHYKTFRKTVEVRTVRDVYLIAMKLRAGRLYKNDLSDIIGILMENKQREIVIDYEAIRESVRFLYHSTNAVDQELWKWLLNALESREYENLYNQVVKEEKSARNVILESINKNPELNNEADVKSVLKLIQAKRTK